MTSREKIDETHTAGKINNTVSKATVGDYGKGPARPKEAGV